MYDYLEANNEANRRRALAWFPSISRHPDVSRDIRSLSGSTGARLSLGDKEAEDLLDFPATRTSSDPCTTSSSTSCTSTWKTFRSPQLEKKKYIYMCVCIKRKKEEKESFLFYGILKGPPLLPRGILSSCGKHVHRIKVFKQFRA